MGANAARQQCQATLLSHGPNGAWTYLAIPFDAVALFGRRGLIPVSGTINGYAFRSSLKPDGTGAHSLEVNKAMLAGAQARPGDVLRLTLELDTAERTVDIPAEQAVALKSHPELESRFAGLAYSHRKEYADWVAGAKKAETRAARAQKAIEMLLAGKRGR